jgi:hypothetical protein
MTTSNVATELRKLVQQLHDERAEYIKAIEAIDQTFHELGLDAHKTTVKARRGRSAGSKNTVNIRENSNRKMPTATADAFVLSFIQANPGCTTAQVNKHWITEGRNGKADQTLFKLVKNGQIVRKSIEGRRGSTFIAM